MSVFEGLVLSMLTGCGIVLALVLVTCSRILEQVNYVVSICREGEEAGALDEASPQPFVSPTDMPYGRDLMDIIGKPPQDDGNTGTFQGHLPWGPPPEPKV